MSLKALQIAFQLLKEFWFPLVAAGIWTMLVHGGLDVKSLSIWTQLAITFVPAFFFLSWLTGQFFRVSKQQRMEGSLVSVENRIEKLVGDLERETTEILSTLTGGNSFCMLTSDVTIPAKERDSLLTFTQILVTTELKHQGKHPLYDIFLTLHDLNPTPTVEDPIVSYKIGDLQPGGMYNLGYTLLIEEGDSPYRDYSPFLRLRFDARNGSFEQIVRYRKVGNAWLKATLVTGLVDDEKQVATVDRYYEQVAEGFPRDENGNVDWYGSEFRKLNSKWIRPGWR